MSQQKVYEEQTSKQARAGAEEKPLQTILESRQHNLRRLQRGQADGGEVVPGLSGVLLRNAPGASPEGPGDDEAQADGSGHLQHKSPLQKPQQAPGDVLQEGADPRLCQLHREGPQAPRGRSYGEREQAGQGILLHCRRLYHYFKSSQVYLCSPKQQGSV